ncbi:MAG: glycoside hydrolase family 32 protein [Bacteroidetes bacterium]|nr:MAG: glycoside hydrolase family 32 protein [Bacteroidota bacterium]
MKRTTLPLFFALLLALVSCKTEKADPNAASLSPREEHRPAYHFTPDSMWMNDPNGMVFYEGEYHLFYQYYPDSTVWGPMHWGHAVSKDLVSWEHLPIAIYPDSLGLIFSGSAVVDWNNSSGFGQNGKPPLIAIFTQHDMAGERAQTLDFQVQSMAYSLDKGRTWTMYEGNPIVPNPGIRDFRDPKVSWHEATKQWVMIFAAKDRVRFYTSPDLKAWTFASEFGEKLGAHGGVWECPDMFPLSVEGTNLSKWVILSSINPGAPNVGSGTQYFVGEFDGKTFTPDNAFAGETAHWLDYGRDNYAGVTWSDIPASDGRRLFIGWMSNWSYATVVPTERWRSATTLPRTLSLRQTEGGLRLSSMPVRELEKLRSEAHPLAAMTLSGEKTLPVSGPLLELDLEWETGDTPPVTFGLKLFNSLGEEVRIGYRTIDNQYFIDRSKAGKSAFSDNFAGLHIAPRQVSGNRYTMRIWLDVASAELFADGGLTTMTDIFFPNEDFGQVAVFSEGGEVKVRGMVWGVRGF